MRSWRLLSVTAQNNKFKQIYPQLWYKNM